jgi:predicted ATPase
VLSALRELADGEPRLLVIDDLHWAEPSSLQLLGQALGSLRGLPVLVLATVRTDPAGRFDNEQVGELGRHCDVLVVAPLDDDAIAALATARTGGGLAGDLRDDLIASAAGNPLFACELAGLLTSTDPSDRDAWLASAAHGVPQALQSLLLRPLEGIPPGAGDVLAAVAVAGDHATLDTISASVPAADARRQLDWWIASAG